MALTSQCRQWGLSALRCHLLPILGNGNIYTDTGSSLQGAKVGGALTFLPHQLVFDKNFAF